jgi:hypothetical protein
VVIPSLSGVLSLAVSGAGYDVLYRETIADAWEVGYKLYNVRVETR